MAEPAHLTAATGTTELHVEPSAFGLTAAGWVALSMFVVIAIMLWKKVPAMIGRMLDARIEVIRKQIDEAARLRADAEAQLSEAQARNAASARDAEDIVAHARREAEAMRVKAEADTAELIRAPRQNGRGQDRRRRARGDRRSAGLGGRYGGQGRRGDHRGEARRRRGQAAGRQDDRRARPPQLRKPGSLAFAAANVSATRLISETARAVRCNGRGG